MIGWRRGWGRIRSSGMAGLGGEMATKGIESGRWWWRCAASFCRGCARWLRSSVVIVVGVVVHRSRGEVNSDNGTMAVRYYEVTQSQHT